MKWFNIFILGLIISSCASSRISYQRANEFFPIDSGNYWIYVDSIWMNDELKKIKHDTVKVSDYMGYQYIDYENKSLMAEGDSVLCWYATRNLRPETDIWFYPVTENEKMNIYDDDISIERKLMPLKNGIRVNKTNYYDCIKYEDQCKSYFIIARGVGLIESKRIHCQKRHQLIHKKSLLKYRLNL